MIAQLPPPRTAGIDTWSPAWYVNEGTKAARAMSALATIRVPRGYALEHQVAGHKIGWFPASGLVWAEGHPQPDGLASGEQLPQVLCDLEEALWDHGIPVQPRATRSAWAPGRPQTADRQAGFAGVRRLDVTADLHYDSSAEGLAVLTGIAALNLPRTKLQMWRAHGLLETVAFHGLSGGKMLARWYDKSREAGLGARGTVIRAEDQRRWPSQQRRGVEELTTPYCRDKFQQRFTPLWRATKGVTVGGPMVLASRLADLQDEGVLTPREAEQLAGYAILHEAGAVRCSRWTEQRRRRSALDAGVVLADDAMNEVRVDLHDVLDRVMDEAAWQ